MIDEPLSRPLLPPDEITFRRHRKGRNLLLFFVLIGVAALFYALTVVKFH